jgi:DNA protection during starvation protein
MSKEKTKKILNQTLADLSQFAAIIHQIHWYVRGERFYSVHELMDKLYAETNKAIDEVAERLIIIGGSPYSSLKEFLENSSLESTKGDYSVSIESHINTLISSYKHMAKLYREGIEVSEKDSDAVTADIFTGLLNDTEKTLWMLCSTLNKAPELE